MSARQRAAAIAVTIGALVTLVGTFLTWVRSGSANRSSYQVFDLVDRLGFSSGGIVGWALRLWPLVPLLLVLTVVAWWWPSSQRAWLIARLALALATVVYAGVTALAVANAPDAGLLTIGDGPIVTVTGAAVMLLGVVIALLPIRSS